jgi:hypothetical protein
MSQARVIYDYEMAGHMKSVRKGSMVLTCMFFISVCTVIMLLHWQSQAAIQKTMIMRVQMMQAQYAAEALMQYGVELCKKEYATLSKKLSECRRPIMIRFSQWPLGDEQYAQGEIEISYTTQLQIRATLERDKKSLIELSCFLRKERRDERNFFTISGWKWHEISPTK